MLPLRIYRQNNQEEILLPDVNDFFLENICLPKAVFASYRATY